MDKVILKHDETELDWSKVAVRAALLLSALIMVALFAAVYFAIR